MVVTVRMSLRNTGKAFWDWIGLERIEEQDGKPSTECTQLLRRLPNSTAKPACPSCKSYLAAKVSLGGISAGLFL